MSSLASGLSPAPNSTSWTGATRRSATPSTVAGYRPGRGYPPTRFLTPRAANWHSLADSVCRRSSLRAISTQPGHSHSMVYKSG
eukprot:7086051-Lingulodinium_polyedra.AAC.1